MTKGAICQEILDKYVDLDKSFLSDSENKQVMDVLYKDTFSLRDEIGICPNIEVEIDVTDKSPFFFRPYDVKEEDKNIVNREMGNKKIVFLRYIKGSFFSIFGSCYVD